MKRIILCLSLFAFFGSQAQQVNPVPDYVFRNQMSVGRNAVTDTAAYMSIGPRYGANKGLMPPIVSDTAAITGVKRNGLLIFSVQRNNFQYWDSINSRWTSITANVDTTIISTRAWRKKGDDSLGAVIATRTDTTLLSTRAWRQKGLDSLAAIEIDGSGTVNYVPKFTATRTLGNSQIFDNGTNVGIGTASPTIESNTAVRELTLTKSGDATNIASLNLQGDRSNDGAVQTRVGTINFWQTNNNIARINGLRFNANNSGGLSFETNNSGSGLSERLRIFANGRIGVNTTTDAGYQFDVAGSIRNTTGANFATSSGDVGIGTTSPSRRLTVKSDGIGISLDNTNNNNAAIEYVVNPAKYNWTLAAQRNVNNGFEITPSTAVGGTTYTTPIFTVLQTGNIGINTTAPSEALHVVGRGRFTTIDSTSSPINVLTSDVNGVIRKTAPGVQGSGTTNRVAKFTASGTIGDGGIVDLATAERMRVTSAGDLYMGVTSDVLSESTRRTLILNGDSSALIGFRRNNADLRGYLLASGTGFIIASNNTSINFNVGSGGATEAMRIGNNSEVLIGTTTDNGDYKLQVAGNIYSTTGGALAATSGEVYIGTTTDVGDYRLQVNGNANFRDDVLIDTNLRVNRHISLDQTPKAWALGNAIEGPQGSTLFVAGGGVQTLANVYYDGSYKYSTSNPGAAMFLLQSGITFATYGSGTANGALTGANEMVYAGGELRVGLADQGTFKLQVADKSYFGDEVQIASTTDLGNYKLQVTGEAIITAGIRTDAPSGGTAATWKLGTVATVSPTSPNRTIEVEIGGTTYYIHAKTTND